MQGFRRLWFDTVVYDARTLRFLADMAGPDRLLMGTDLPFAIAEMEPVRLVDACGFTPHERAAILGDTAAALFGIPSAAARAAE